MRTVLILAAATALMATGANAQMFKPKPKPAAAPAAAPASTAAPMAARTTHTSSTATTHGGKPRTAESIDCSKQADAKGLHGNDRKKFRSSCVKAAKH
ncbi:MAG: PsiF family protein [Caulobacteraceae bacterium]